MPYLFTVSDIAFSERAQNKSQSAYLPCVSFPCDKAFHPNTQEKYPARYNIIKVFSDKNSKTATNWRVARLPLFLNLQLLYAAWSISPYHRPVSKGAGFHFVQATMPLTLLPPQTGRLYYLLPLKGSSYSFTLNLSKAISCFSCS